jgi:hypothetical protein
MTETTFIEDNVLVDGEVYDVTMPMTHRVVRMTRGQYLKMVSYARFAGPILGRLHDGDPSGFFPLRERNTNKPATREKVLTDYRNGVR